MDTYRHINETVVHPQQEQEWVGQRSQRWQPGKARGLKPTIRNYDREIQPPLFMAEQAKRHFPQSSLS